MTTEIHQSFMVNKVTIKKKLLKIIGGEFRIYAEGDRLVLFAEQEGLKIKEVFHIYADENKSEELLEITTPHIIDFAASYIITDKKTGAVVGAVKREGIRSIVMDEWTLMDGTGNIIGKLKEESVFGAIMSRLIKLIPQRYVIFGMQAQNKIVEIARHFDPFVLKFDMSIVDVNPGIDRRILFGTLILLTAIEGREK